MIKKMKVISIGAALVALTCSPVLAADYMKMSTEEMAGMRGSMQQESQTERSAFQKEWQARVRQMSTEEKQQYMGPSTSSGIGGQYKKGNRGSGAGAGMGSGSGRGGRR